MIFGEISVAKSSLNLKMMLEGGQCFRWKEIAPFEWIGTISNVVWSIKQSDHSIKYQVLGGDLSKCTQSEDCIQRSVGDDILKAERDLIEQKLKSYFRLDAPLEMFYEEWSKKDPNFKLISTKCYGIRILNQDPVENVFSFICSSNNNIKRISSLVEKLCKLYGPKLCEVDGVEYYGFPEISDLARSQESDLRKAGFGYRAKFICESAKQLEALGGPEWLEKLRNTSYLDAKSQLIKLPGIGAKVADCICLMSLGHMEALPVDTHVYQIACHSYLPHLKKVKNLTDKIYNEIGDYFRHLYGPYAGWAHTVLFCGDLKAFKDSPSNLEKEKSTMAEKGDDSQGTAKRPRLKKKTGNNVGS